MALVAKPMLFSSCSSVWIALPSLLRNEVYRISGPLACGSDLLFPTEEVPEKLQEQIHRVNSTLSSSSESWVPFEQRMQRVWHRKKERRGLTRPGLPWRM
jgi:hypothetical protein